MDCAACLNLLNDQIDQLVLDHDGLDDIAAVLFQEGLDLIVGQHITSSTENRGTLSLRIYDPEINRSIKMTSGVKIPINKQLIDMLKDMDIEYHVNE